jgi:hypothetical protein
MKNRQHNGQKKKGQSTNNDLQNTTQKTKDRVTRTMFIQDYLRLYLLLMFISLRKTKCRTVKTNVVQSRLMSYSQD